MTTTSPLTSPLVCSAAAIESRLQDVLQPQVLEVVDESAAHAGHAGSNGLGHGTHFRVRIWASAFDGKGRIANHRLVYDALRQFLDAGLHALAIEISPPPTDPLRGGN